MALQNKELLNFNKSVYIKILIGITAIALLFHLLILVKIIPYNITWGGKLKTDEEMVAFESISIAISSFFIYVLLQKGNFVKAFFTERILSILLWIFFSLFCLNTIGNLVAETTFEKAFAFVTAANALLLWKINKT